MDISSTVKAIILLGLDGKRVLAKYFDDKIIPNQFDKEIFLKTKSRKTKNEILALNNYLVIHRCVTDLHMYVVGARNENPLILDKVLYCLVETVTTLMNKSAEKQSIRPSLDLIILALDEICDGGIVLETDPNLVLDRVCLKEGAAEQSMAQVLQSATEHIRFSWLRS